MRLIQLESPQEQGSPLWVAPSQVTCVSVALVREGVPVWSRVAFAGGDWIIVDGSPEQVMRLLGLL